MKPTQNDINAIIQKLEDLKVAVAAEDIERGERDHKTCELEEMQKHLSEVKWLLVLERLYGDRNA